MIKWLFYFKNVAKDSCNKKKDEHDDKLNSPRANTKIIHKYSKNYLISKQK